MSASLSALFVGKGLKPCLYQSKNVFESLVDWYRSKTEDVDYYREHQFESFVGWTKTC